MSCLIKMPLNGANAVSAVKSPRQNSFQRKIIAVKPGLRDSPPLWKPQTCSVLVNKLLLDLALSPPCAAPRHLVFPPTSTRCLCPTARDREGPGGCEGWAAAELSVTSSGLVTVPTLETSVNPAAPLLSTVGFALGRAARLLQTQGRQALLWICSHKHEE